MRLWFFYVLAVLLISNATADMMVYGDSFLEDEPVSVGSNITAKVGDQIVSSYVVREPGSYGHLIGFNGSMGAPIEFYCGDFRAAQILPFSNEGIVALNLDFRFYEPKSPTTTLNTPAVIGNAVAVTVSDNVMVLGVFVLLAIIAFSIKDIMT